MTASHVMFGLAVTVKHDSFGTMLTYRQEAIKFVLSINQARSWTDMI